MSRGHNEGLAWETWFTGLDTDEGLRDRVILRVEPLQQLEHATPVAACEALRTAWRGTYFPSNADLAVIRQFVERVRLMLARRIPSVGAYQAAIYGRQPIVPAEQEIWSATGLAGVGKSSAMKAVARAIRPKPSDCIVPSVQVSPEPIAHITIKAQRSSGIVLQSMANPQFVAGRKNIPAPELAQHLREWLYTRCTQLLLVDELQSMTRSESATTLIANLITELNELGPAVAYIFNYSLGHKLLLRQQEDKDRLLVKCLSFDPPGADDPHWAQVVSEYVNLAPDLLNIDGARDAAELHRLTGGIYRLLGFLLLQACRSAWQFKVGRAVTMADVRASYQSGAFASQREDVETLRSLQFNGRLRDRRKDLVSPFPGLVTRNGAASTAEASKPLQHVPAPAAVHLMESALNAGAKQLLKGLRAGAGVEASLPKASATVTRLPRRRPPTAEELLNGEKLLADRAKTGKWPRSDESETSQ